MFEAFPRVKVGNPLQRTGYLTFKFSVKFTKRTSCIIVAQHRWGENDTEELNKKQDMERLKGKQDMERLNNCFDKDDRKFNGKTGI